MNDKLVFGQYYHGNSIIHRLDPRTKIIFTLLIMVAAFFIPTKNESIMISFILLGSLGLLVLILILCTKVPLIRFLKSLKQVFLLIVFAGVFQLLINEGDHYLGVNINLTIVNICLVIFALVIYFIIRKYLPFKLLFFILVLIGCLYILQYPIYGSILNKPYELKFYRSGLLMALLLILRVMIVILTSTILTLTTKPTDLTNGLELLLKPLEALKIKTSIFAMMVSIALRFIPTLFNETDKILKAQASRGADFKEGKFRNQIMQIVSLLIPMFVISIKRAFDLADAMEARGYIPGAKRTRLVNLKLKANDIFMLLLGLIVTAGIITLSILTKRGFFL